MAASAATYAIFWAAHGLWESFLCFLATGPVELLCGMPHTLVSGPDGAGLVRAGDGRIIPLGELSTLWSEMPLYLGLCAVTFRAAWKAPGKVGLGLVVLPGLQAMTLTVLAASLAWPAERPGFAVVAWASALMVRIHWAGPCALWWAQFCGAWGSKQAPPHLRPESPGVA